MMNSASKLHFHEKTKQTFDSTRRNCGVIRKDTISLRMLILIPKFFQTSSGDVSMEKSVSVLNSSTWAARCPVYLSVSRVFICHCPKSSHMTMQKWPLCYNVFGLHWNEEPWGCRWGAMEGVGQVPTATSWAAVSHSGWNCAIATCDIPASICVICANLTADSLHSVVSSACWLLWTVQEEM